MRSIVLITGLLLIQQVVLAQINPYSQAEKAIVATKDEPIQFDSLRRVYKKRWTIGLTYGQRFIENANRTSVPDTITFADFTKKRVYYGMEGSYFVSQNVQLFLGITFLMLPREQNISSISFRNNGLQIEGSGSGGAMLSGGIGARYMFLANALWRPHVGLQMGIIRAIARGGSVSGANIQNVQITELTRSYGYGNLTLGVNHRLAPGSMLDLSIGFLKANRTNGIGGIVSPTGLTASFSIHIVINARKD